jgi:hypothetical protein
MFGKHILDLAPTPENRRNSEGCFLTLKDGRILFVYTRYGAEGYQDGCNADLYAIISDDNGETFGAPTLFYGRDRIGADNVMSVTLRRMDNGDMGLFFLRKIEGTQCNGIFVRSADEGKTWSEPLFFTEPLGYICVNPDRIIRLKSGRWLAVGSIHRSTQLEDTPDGKRKITEDLTAGKLQVYASDDDGFTWKTIVQGISLPTSRYCTTGVQEPGILQLADGRIWCFIRTDYGRQYECFSSDDGATWTEPEASWFTSPDSPLSMKRLADGKLFAVWNPIPRGNIRPWRIDGAMTGSRTPLVCAVSRDEGATWENITTIENDDRRGFCYIAIHELNDGSILLGYCAGSPEDKCCLSRLRIRKLTKEDMATL